MKVRELIEALKSFDPEAEVALADWNEQHAMPTKDFKIIGFRKWTDFNDETLKYEETSGVVIGEGATEEYLIPC